MHAVAWDTARISSYVVGGAFISVWTFFKTRKSQPTEELFTLIAIPTLALNVFVHIPLMDDELDRFSDPERALLYLPALLFALYAVVTNNSWRISPSNVGRSQV
jgi:hypothetical protein